MNFSAFHNELTKIGEADNKTATKARLKRLALGAGAAGAGAGLGEASARLLGRVLKGKKGVDVGRKLPSSVRKYGPKAVGALAGLGTMLAASGSGKLERFIHDGPK